LSSDLGIEKGWMSPTLIRHLKFSNPHHPKTNLSEYIFHPLSHLPSSFISPQNTHHGSGKCPIFGYSLVEPDGSRRIVDYIATPEGGFQPTVRILPLELPLICGAPVYGLPELPYPPPVYV
jgi:hypothetical protein